MKTKLFAILALAALTLTVRAQADTNAPAPSIQHGLTEVWNAVETSGITTATNYAIEPYATYMAKAPAGNKFGGGILAIYNVNNYVGAGLGIDYLGQFSLVSANIALKMPIHVGTYLPSSWTWATNVVVTPFALTGVGTALSGTSQNISAIEDAGGYLSFGHVLGGRLNVGIAYGQWLNAGKYTGQRDHIFFGWSKGF